MRLLLIYRMLMLIYGVLIVIGGVINIVPSGILPVEQIVGTDASAAAVALGIGIMVGSLHLENNWTWARIAIVYSALVIVMQLIFLYAVHAPFRSVPFILSLIMLILLIVLHPDKSQLFPRSRTTTTTTTTGTHGETVTRTV